VLAQAGWDVERDGLLGAPRVRVVASVERHATIDRSLRLLGFGSAVVEPVAADRNGAIDVEDLQRLLTAGPAGPTIVCLQAGNVNTGACDDLRAGCAAAHDRGAWVHVDGAFGLWAAVSPARAGLVDGVELADSWACDGHKWLNLPYDCGFALCAHPRSMSRGCPMPPPTSSDPAVRQLGAHGLAELVERCCVLATRFADGLAARGVEIANEVVLNQVLARFGDVARTDRVIDGVQREGTCWMGGTTWRGRRYMRISVSNADTTESDVDRSIAAVLRVAGAPSGDARAYDGSSPTATRPTSCSRPGCSRPSSASRSRGISCGRCGCSATRPCRRPTRRGGGGHGRATGARRPC